MDRSRLLLLKRPVYLMIAFLLGILLAHFWREQELGKLVALVVVALLVLLRLGYGGVSGFKFFVSIAVFLGFFRFFYSFELPANHVVNFLGEVQMKGCISAEPDVRDDKVKYIVDVLWLADGDNGDGEAFWREVSGKVLVYGDRYPVYNYGDCLLVAGFLQRPDLIEDFDYEKYLARYGIYAVMYRASASKLGEGLEGGDWFLEKVFFSWIYKFKVDFEGRLRRLFSEPYASFLSGLLLGSRRGIPQELTADFNTTGLSHIVAISGYNITLVIAAVSMLLGFLDRKKKVVFAGMFIVVFVVMVGMSAAVVRAAIMGIISLVAIWFGRQYMVTVALIASAFLMNLWNPKILVYDIGFQLSFMATAGIIYLYPVLESYLKSRHIFSLYGFSVICESLALTLSAQIFTLPIIMLNFGRLSLIAPVANLFVLPFIPFIMLFGFFAVMLSYFWNFLAVAVGLFAYLMLKLVIVFVTFFADIMFASVGVEWFRWWMMPVCYLLIWRIVVGKSSCNTRN